MGRSCAHLADSETDCVMLRRFVPESRAMSHEAATQFSTEIQRSAEATVADRIQEVLLQQRVSKLLDDWLASLRAQGNVVVLHADDPATEVAR